MSQESITITRGKRQVEPGWGQPRQLQTLYTIAIGEREALTTRNAAFVSAFEKGANARLAGKPASTNPYPDYRTDRGSVTFARAYWRHWKHGWEAADQALREQVVSHQKGTP